MAKEKSSGAVLDPQDFPLDDTPAKAEARKALADDDPAKFDPAVNPLNPKLKRSHKHKPFKVEATQVGYYADKLRRVGDVFTVNSEREFSPKWMKRVSASTPERLTGSAADLKRIHDEGGAAVPPAEETPTGDGDPLQLT